MDASRAVILEFAQNLIRKKKMSAKEIYDCFDELTQKYAVAV